MNEWASEGQPLSPFVCCVGECVIERFVCVCVTARVKEREGEGERNRIDLPSLDGWGHRLNSLVPHS